MGVLLFFHTDSHAHALHVNRHTNCTLFIPCTFYAFGIPHGAMVYYQGLFIAVSRGISVKVGLNYPSLSLCLCQRAWRKQNQGCLFREEVRLCCKPEDMSILFSLPYNPHMIMQRPYSPIMSPYVCVCVCATSEIMESPGECRGSLTHGLC